MSEATLYLAWQDRAASRLWFPVGRLDAGPEQPNYRFRYTRGARRALRESRFIQPVGFPELDGDYRSDRLFPLFRNRVINSRRDDRGAHLQALDLESEATSVEILSRSGGRRVTDAYEVFPRLRKAGDGSFACRFLLHGWRHTNEDAQRRLEALNPGDELHLAVELTNPRDGLAVQVQTQDYHMLGWAPRYLVDDLARALAEYPREHQARVVRLSPRMSWNQKLLVEVRGRWDIHEPMSGPEYKPLVGDD